MQEKLCAFCVQKYYALYTWHFILLHPQAQPTYRLFVNFGSREIDAPDHSSL